ncbi:sulfate adenylyltransferase subunit CysN [Roseimicrobium sp. ORNL1]|uniref:sulfate adenylyltransferase subunit CysN n=1 Tax=Roseimicrobium sp. ORNL1 TaxID=2711231 RepID=UPI0013E1BDFB|nr:sulfate adenylyltransferase subunit CysN [Roseimicrobium sp. ORNL1]QIF05118.1 sulfate adenylyltransferase subunit CysN [Roseimicrobium sp. ORNL1]
MDLLVNPTESSLLRFTTAGSVDDGKSTLIGRLLYDSKSIFEDQLLAVEESSKRRGDAHVNLALLTDGLRAEREQGITIDVAYRYFATPKRKFIIADTPGHIQYTRNMVTGASTADLAIILVDARHGVVEQTRRHSYLASLLRIEKVVLAVNKMDLVDFSQEVFDKIIADFNEFRKSLPNEVDATLIPISALNGDNVVDKSDNTPWYSGKTLLEHLETVQVRTGSSQHDARFPVQWVIRPMSDDYHDFRGFAGRMASGTFKVGEEVLALPAGMTSRITGIHTFEGRKEETTPDLSYSITLADEIDISRGDMIVRPDQAPQHSPHIDAMICWFTEKKLKPRTRFHLRHTTRDLRATVTDLHYKVDISTMEQVGDVKEFGLNDIGCIRIKCAAPLFFDAYSKNRTTGSFVLVDEQTNNTVAAGMILRAVGDETTKSTDEFAI